MNPILSFIKFILHKTKKANIQKMFKKSTLKLMPSTTFEMSNERIAESDFTLQEKLELILERPNFSRLRAAEDAAASDSE